MELTSKIPLELREEFDNISFLGRGGQGLTFRATRKSDLREVVLKVLDFPDLSSWKDYELFLRDIAVLRTLDHRSIPKVLGVSPKGDEPDAVVLIQEYFEGASLQEMLDRSGGPWSEEDVGAFLEELLEILAYLHAPNPPLVHRDIKPSNIIRRQDGTFALIDFGAASATNASTFLGTNGYMAPEQMMGRAEPRSDLYSLGATALHLATGIHPNDLSREDFSLRLDGLGLSSGFVRIIARLVHPLPEKRFRNAVRARHGLRPSQELVVAEVAERAPLGPQRRLMWGTTMLFFVNFKLVRREGDTQIEFPRSIPFPALSLLALCLYFGTKIFFDVPVVFSYLFIAAISGIAIYLFLRQRQIIIDDEDMHYVKRLGPYSRVKSWRVDEIIDIRSQKRGAFLVVVLQDKSASRHSVGLSSEQAQWLVQKVLEELEERR